jgi:hypothetical protein
MRFFSTFKNRFVALTITAGFVVFPGLQVKSAPTSASENRLRGLGVITGYVRDEGGNPIADATVAIFRAGTSKLLKQVASAANGKFTAKIVPGTYSVLAVAQGFNPVTIPNVEVGQAAQLEYGFRLQRAGSGNTLPERRVDRNNPKWSVRSAAITRSIYQNNQDSKAVIDETAGVADENNASSARKFKGLAATYYSSSDRGNFTGFNIAALVPIKENADLIVAGQTGIGAAAPERIDTELRFKPVEDHQIRVKSSYENLGTVIQEDKERNIGQFSVQATDEWAVRDGVILVYGFDFSKFTGAGNDFSFSPRIGFQLDLDPKTRVRAAYTTQTEDRTWSRAIELEGAEVFFREPVSVEDFAIVSGKPQMNRSSRLEFGIERVLDNSSSIEANVFVDTIFGRGVGFTMTPFDSTGGDFTEFTGKQEGGAKGLRLVYARRINGKLTASAGYSFGLGQRVSHNAISKPDELFENSAFSSFFGQLEADLKSGTNIKTVFRLSPEATVFAIDPFQGRLSIYDPGLSVFITQSLPTWGLPFRAQAIVDARNVFDFKSGVFGEEGSLRLNTAGSTIRGGILVSF